MCPVHTGSIGVSAHKQEGNATYFQQLYPIQKFAKTLDIYSTGSAPFYSHCSFLPTFPLLFKLVLVHGNWMTVALSVAMEDAHSLQTVIAWSLHSHAQQEEQELRTFRSSFQSQEPQRPCFPFCFWVGVCFALLRLSPARGPRLPSFAPSSLLPMRST